jgi:N-acetylmuramoyl-L-alanine amidase
VALELREVTKSDNRLHLILTRDKNQTRSLKTRVQIAESNNADLFISLHANSESTRKAKGVEFYFQSQAETDEEMQYLASLENHNLSVKEKNNSEISKQSEVQAIIADLKKQHAVRTSHRLSRKMAEIWQQSSTSQVNIRQAPFYVVSRAKMPSILIELGFISNPKEAEKLNTKDYQKEIAKRLYMGILQFKEMVDNQRLAGL